MVAIPRYPRGLDSATRGTGEMTALGIILANRLLREPGQSEFPDLPLLVHVCLPCSPFRGVISQLPYDQLGTDANKEVKYLRDDSTIHDLRDKNNADIVVLVGDIKQFCGTT